MENEKIDLEKLRDEKCIPIAKAIFSEMATDLINSKDNQEGLAIKGLSLMVEKDLNIDTEVSFVPQLILRTLSEMNSTFQSCDIIPIDDERYGEIAKKILTIISESDIKMSELTPEEATKEFEPIKEKLNSLFSEEKINKLELGYIKDMIFDAFTTLNNLMQNSIAGATERAEAKALGVERMTELGLKRLDDFLRN